MAVEAVSQLHHEATDSPSITGYSLRSVAIQSALQVPDNDVGIETILNMQAVALTGSKLSSKWFQFMISSVLPNTDTWTEHCSGLISVETVRPIDASKGKCHILLFSCHCPKLIP